jgi:DNA-binding response OmpR family regulator
VLERKSARLLIVDDDEATLRLVSTIVTTSGFQEPALARTGHGGLALASEADIVLLDHQLPDGTGLDFLPALQALETRPSVVLITAHGNESVAAQALRLGADDYLIKDPSLPTLLPQVLERVRRSRALQEALASAERDLVHAERLAAIGQLNVTLHHTINNPLMAASAETDLLLADRERLSPTQQESLQAIKTALQQIRDTLQRVGTLQHARTAEYLDGVSMIDLSRRTQPQPVIRGDAVIYLPDEDTARVLALLLKHAGFAVERARTRGELETLAARLGMALVVVAGSAGAGGVDPLGGFRPGGFKTYTLVALVAGDGTAARSAGADYVVSLPFDPGTFTQDLLAAMQS